MIKTTQEAGKKTNSVINTVYEGYVGHLVVVQFLVMPHVRHVCVLLALVIPYVRHAHLDLNTGVNLKSRATCI